MDILQMGAWLLKNSMGEEGNQNTETVSGVLQQLIGSGDQFDLPGMVSAMQSGGMASIASSWLGDGSNEAVSESQVRDAIGGDKIAEAAAQLGTDENTLLSGLSQALPQIVDHSSRGGSLIGTVGGLGDAIDLVKLGVCRHRRTTFSAQWT